MRSISIDIETYSSADLSKCGVYKYVESADFCILLFAYSIDKAPVRVVDLAQGGRIPAEILQALSDPKIQKWAYNASFERVCLSRYLGMPSGHYLDPVGWYCSLTWAATAGLPLSLAQAGAVLELDRQKIGEGRFLVKTFSQPDREGRHIRAQDEPEKWLQFKEYNVRDVEAELEIQDKLRNLPVRPEIWQEYWLDQRINDRGVKIDLALVESALAIDAKIGQSLLDRLKALTGLPNPASVSQLTKWLSDHDVKTESLGKRDVLNLINTSQDPTVEEVLKLRQQSAKSSLKKYQAMQRAMCSDGRCRGMFQFYGANRTGRWAGRLVQLQNLPQNHIEPLAGIRQLVKKKDLDSLETLIGPVPDTLSQLIRTAFIAKPGTRFIVADFSAIEARVIAWLAGETWRLKVFAEGGDIYCASASQMFRVPVVKHGVNGHLRQKGKVAELACGYGGAVGALKAMGAAEMGLTEPEMVKIIQQWRAANPNIVKLWWKVDSAVKAAITEGKSTYIAHGLTVKGSASLLQIVLPSGRMLNYIKPEVTDGSISYMGTGQSRGWSRLESYGPKFVENIVQAISRDLLCAAMQRLRDAPIVMHIHDELVIEAGPEYNLKDVCETMGQTPPWADGLLLRADGYETSFYKKD